MNSLKNLIKRTKKVSVVELFMCFNKSMQQNIEAMHILRETVKDIYDNTEWDYLIDNDRRRNR